MALLVCGSLVVLLLILIAAAVAISLAQQHRKLKELCAYGCDAEAAVESSVLMPGYKIGGVVSVVPQRASRERKIVYRYTDEAGTPYTGSFTARATDVPTLADLRPGMPFPIVYSSRYPAVSAPKHLVDLYRPAMMRRPTPSR